jgi:hypothetical protein
MAAWPQEARPRGTISGTDHPVACPPDSRRRTRDLGKVLIPHRQPGIGRSARCRPLGQPNYRPLLIGDLAHAEDGYQRSVMCLTAWLITNAGAGLCIRMRRGNSLISATWPRFATPVRGSPTGPVRASTHWWDAIGSGVTHAGMRAEARPRRAWAGWARWGFLNSPVLLCTSAVRRPVG